MSQRGDEGTTREKHVSLEDLQRNFRDLEGKFKSKGKYNHPLLLVPTYLVCFVLLKELT